MKQTFRSLMRAPVLSLAAVVTLALGIAFTTTMFSVVDAVVLKPLPFREPDRVVSISDVNAKSGERDQVSASNFEDLEASAKTLRSLSLWIREPVTVAGSGEPERVESLRVSPSLFAAFGVSPVIGRGFREREENVIVLGPSYWQSHFGSDPRVVGRTVRVDGIAHTIVGVLPPDFRYPDAEIAFWQPLVLKDFERRYRGKRMFEGVARLAPGATLAEAKAELKAISASLARQYAEANRDWTTEARLAHEALAPKGRTLWLLLGAAVLVLVLASANVANLLFARASATRADMEIRTALGATRSNIIGHYLRESALLAVAGTAAGVLLAARLIDLVVAIRPAGLPTWNRVELDVRALAAAVVSLLFATLLAGMLPAIISSREIARRAIGARFGVATERGGKLRRALTAAQVALAVVLLVGAVLLVRSMLAVQSVDAGFGTGGRVAATIIVPATQYDKTREVALFTRFFESLRAWPGVVSAGGVTSLPLNRAGVDYSVETYVEGFTPGQREPEADFRLTTPDYFRTMGIPLVRGRELLVSDDTRAPRVAIINEAFARAYVGSREAVGLALSLYCADCERIRIVGVVRDTRHRALDGPVRPEVYIPFTQMPHGELTIVVRAQGNPAGAVTAMRQILTSLDPNLALSNVATLDEIVTRSIDARRFDAQLLAAFSVCALLLAAIGLYGSLSFSIGQRRQEIAVRVALGATRSNVWRLVLVEAATPVVAGLVVGVLGASLASASLRAMMFGVTTTDPVTYGVVVSTFAAVVLLVAFAGFRRLAIDDVRKLLQDA